ncbi:MAG: D-alanyl-D-alanine carboxypeptidase, partial [Clostridia bacterium]|nr:D-alanyl-D-alanine carboxypeptidase [Clostridia bacterium]
MPTVADVSALNVKAKSAVLMEMTSGTVLFEQNAHAPLPVASVTKVMTLLLVMEAIDDGQLSLDETVTTSARAASMGGSQIWLEENETMSVRDLLKAAVIVSANDACAALAEHLCGTIEAFVAKMNERAKALGAKNTRFVDCSGLSDDGVSSAYDIALISRELMMAHPSIKEYTTVWMDSLRGGASELVNTNRLVRFYNGATGLKTGTTGAAGYCLSATAQRGG